MKLGAAGRRVVLALLICGVPAGWAAGLAGAASGDCSQAGRTVTCTFTYTGSQQTFTVPAGVGSVQIAAVGAPGGGVIPGLGGTTAATVAVTASQTLYVVVGGVGTGSAGGFNGGGAPGSSPVSNGEGGGGGASDVRTVSGSLASRLVVAAGGGGSGGAGNDSGARAPGGAAGADGGGGRNSSGDANDTGGGAGLAGTTTAGGAFGAGGAPDSGGAAGGDGTAGNTGVGGPGGGGDGGAGGGGGGGYYGGGGGGGGGESVGHQAGGGGGGGGSCYALGPVACGADQSGIPSVTITYTLPDTTAPTISIAAPAANAVYSLGAAVTASYSCADEAGGSGLAACQGPVAPGNPVDTSTAGSHSFTVTARDNAGNPATQTVTYTVVAPPTAPPRIEIQRPLANHTYGIGQAVPVKYTCTDGSGGPGIKSCAGTVKNGGLLNTDRLGTFQFTVTAKSRDGQVTKQTVSYSTAAPKGRSVISLSLRGLVLTAASVGASPPPSAVAQRLSGCTRVTKLAPQCNLRDGTFVLRVAYPRHAPFKKSQHPALFKGGGQNGTLHIYARAGSNTITLTFSVSGAWLGKLQLTGLVGPLAIETFTVHYHKVSYQGCSPSSLC